MNVVSKHERLQAKELLRRGVPVDVDAQPRLEPAAAAVAARPDADVANDLVVPAQVGRIVGVREEVFPERCPVPTIDPQLDVVHDGVVEEGRRLVRQWLCLDRDRA